MAIAFAQIYAMINAAPTPLGPPFAQLGTPSILDADAGTYFSFVSQTTLGYGDIVPNTYCGRAGAVITGLSIFFFPRLSVLVG